jgi:hypothetical protein
MSEYDYLCSRAIAARDEPFYALIMAAMRKADTDNLEKLKAAWPETWDELRVFYNTPMRHALTTG